MKDMVHPERPHYHDASTQHAYLMGAVDAIDSLLTGLEGNFTDTADDVRDDAHALRDACMRAAEAIDR